MKPSPVTTIEEYFNILQHSEQKLEWHSGEIVATAGAQPNQPKIHARLFITLGQYLESKECMIVGSAILVKAGACGNYYFPDLVIVCKQDEYESSPSGLKALLNPEVIIEILSETTESYDRTFKLDCYKTIPGFRKYIMVHSAKKRIETVSRLSDAEWLSRTYTQPDELIDVEGCEILLGGGLSETGYLADQRKNPGCTVRLRD